MTCTGKPLLQYLLQTVGYKNQFCLFLLGITVLQLETTGHQGNWGSKRVTLASP